MISIESLISIAQNEAMDQALIANMEHERFMRSLQVEPEEIENQALEDQV